MKASLATLVALAHSPLLAQTTELVSVTHTGGGAGGTAWQSTISADGQHVAFTSNAWNILPGYDGYQVYARDLAAGVTRIASVNAAGAGADNVAQRPAISADGRYVAFETPATNMGPGDDGYTDIYVRDLVAGTTERVSLAAGGGSFSLHSYGPAISADGRWVAFTSTADFNLPSDMNGQDFDVFLKDRLTGAIEQISVSDAGIGGDRPSGGESRAVAMTADARYVAFASVATDLVPGDTNGGYNGIWYWGSDIFVRDRLTATTRRVSVATGGAQVDATMGNGASNPAISADGRVVAFASGSNALSPLDTDAIGFDVFVHDVLLGTTRLVSEPYEGPLELPSFYPSISADARFVVFQNGGSSSGPDWHIWVRDLQTGTAELISQSTAGVPADDNSFLSTISADGTRIAFDSYAQNLAPNTSYNDVKAFLRTRETLSDYSSYCFGDHGGTACPCSNASVPEHREGCLHSLGTGGRLTAQGASDAAADTFQLVGTHLPDSFGLFFQGTTRIAGGLGATFGDGLRCAGGSITRLRVKLIAGGTVRYPEAGEAPISVLGGLSVGDLRTYQLWYRNAAAFCTSATFNLTNAIETIW